MAEDDWEADYEETLKKIPVKPAPAAVPVKPKIAKPSSQKATSTSKNDYIDPSTIEDPVERRRFMQAQTELDQARLAADLLDGCDVADDALEELKRAAAAPRLKTVEADNRGGRDNALVAAAALPINTVSEVTKFMQDYFAPKIRNADKATPIALMELVSGVLEAVLPRLDEKEVKGIETRLRNVRTALTTEKRIRQQGKRKFFEKQTDQLKNAQDEYQMIYGDGDPMASESEGGKSDFDDFM